MMLRTWERDRERFAENGIHMVAIGPDDIAVNREMVARIGVGCRMLYDRDQAVSGRYGAVHSNPLIEKVIGHSLGISLPASSLIDADGIVRHVSRPDRVGEFLDPDLIFGALEQLPTNPLPAWS